jgi:hypothetical protein
MGNVATVLELVSGLKAGDQVVTSLTTRSATSPTDAVKTTTKQDKK